MSDTINYIEHAQDVLTHAADLVARDAAFALVNSVAIKGGTARELGSLAIVTPSGEMFGYLSNGCIDHDIRLNAVQALQSGARKLVHYGDGSPFPDLALPCGGMLKVLIDPAPDRDALMAALSDMQARKSARLTFTPEDTETPLTVAYDPKLRVTLAGRGAVLIATAKLAHSSGFEVRCVTPDTHDAHRVAAFCADPVQSLTSPAAPSDLGLDAWSAFLTLFHDHSWEPSLLKAALGSPCRFIGALGSRTTHAARTKVLLSMGCAPNQVAKIRGPVGLVPSLRSADLIAVAVIAELAASFSRCQHVVAPASARLPKGFDQRAGRAEKTDAV